MIKNNSYFDFRNCHEVEKYKNTELCYQSSYEYDFLEYCKKIKIIDNVKNGNIFNFLESEHKYVLRTITDFSIDDIEIEIKSSYILKKQGVCDVIDVKKRTVERTGKKYLLILDKNYSEFISYIEKLK